MDYNKKPEFQDKKVGVQLIKIPTAEDVLGFDNLGEQKEENRKLNEYYLGGMKYGELLAKYKYRKLLIEVLGLTNLICLIFYWVSEIVERMQVLPTAPYRELNVLEWIFLTVSIINGLICIYMNKNQYFFSRL